MPVYALEGVVPVVDPSAFVHPDAVLVGDVVVGPGCYVGPLASLRGDMGRIELHAGSNVQDTCVLHCFPGRQTVVEEGGHIGHGAVLHGCRIGRGALVGINAVVMDGVVVGGEALVAAHSFVKTGARVPDRWLVAGTPAREVRALTAEEVAWKAHGSGVYEQLARRCLAGMRPVEPLPALPPDRPSLHVDTGTAVPLQEYRSAPDQHAQEATHGSG